MHAYTNMKMSMVHSTRLKSGKRVRDDMRARESSNETADTHRHRCSSVECSPVIHAKSLGGPFPKHAHVHAVWEAVGVTAGAATAVGATEVAMEVRMAVVTARAEAMEVVVTAAAKVEVVKAVG